MGWGFVSDIADAAKDVAGAAASAAGRAADAAGDAASGAASAAGQAAGDAFDSAVDGARSAANAAGRAADAAGDVAGDVADSAVSAAGQVADRAGDFAESAWQGARAVASQAPGVLKDIGSDIHHGALDHIPAYRLADGVVHDIKHEITEPDGFDAGSVFASGALRTVHAVVDTVDQRFQNGETIRFNDLDQDSRDYVQAIYGDSIEYEDIRLVVGGSSTGPLAPHVVGNTVYLPNDYVDVDNSGGDPTYSIVDTPLAPKKQPPIEVFGHELAHVWQNQNGGGDYAHQALIDQAEAFVTTGDRDNAYHGTERLDAGVPFENLTPEEQADVAREIGRRLENGDPLSEKLAAAHQAILDGQGAPV